ncbi:SRC2-like protein [Tanacetum coccineum]|uniref:SRC2-like protein n=1 Tax=Tanacetum coccineum TaxID=301880 RepID=A0ABQ4ZZB9_9ASTR
MDPYVLVWLAGEKEQSPVYKTKTAIKGATCPVWNSRVKFNIASRYKNYTLFCEIKHDGTYFDRDLGQVQVRLRDLLAAGDSGENVSYPVKTSSGEIVGEIILSHTISFGENVIDMETNKTEKEGQFAMDVIKVVATVVATVVAEVAIEAAQIVFS